MPVTKSAVKKLRVDRRRTQVNLRFKKRYKKAIKKHLNQASEATLKRVYALVDRAAKKHIIHKNKAARLKRWAALLLNRQISKNKPTPARSRKNQSGKVSAKKSITTKKTAGVKKTKSK